MTAASPQHPKRMALRRSAVIEIAIYLVGSILLDQFFFGGTRFREVSPHPFWPIVLLVAAQYGTSEALLAAFASTAALLLGNIPPQSINQDTYDYLSKLVANPVMWFIAAIALGELRMRHISERDRLREDLSLATKREQDLTAAYGRLTSLKDSLEARVAGQMRTAINMYQAARSLERLDPSEVLLGISDIVHAVMKPERFSLYLRRDDVLEISIGEGWTSTSALSRTFRSDSRLFQEVVARQRCVCIANPDDELVLGKEGVLAGPLIDRETGDVMGMLKIEKMGYFELHFSNVQTFHVLCEWIADAYLNARRFQITESESVFDPKSSLFSYSFYERQIAYLQELATRSGFDLSILLLRLDNEIEFTDHEIRRLESTLKSAVLKVLAKSDMAFDYRRNGYQYCIVLPSTDTESAAIAGDRLITELAIAAPKGRFSYGVQMFDGRQLVDCAE
jgi:polysaccharide biosynthesis protein PelD